MLNITKGNWKKFRHLASSIWFFDRDEDPEDDKFQGAFIYQVAESLILRYTRKGNLVLDMFGGTGTTGRAAVALKRRAVLTDIRYNEKKIRGRGYWQFKKDSTDSSYPEWFCEEFGPADLVILHPPYYDVIKFTKYDDDLSNCNNPADFMKEMSFVMDNAFNCVKEDGHVALVMGDVYSGGRLLPAYYVADLAIDMGLVPKAIFIKNIKGNERKQGSRGLWEYRALKNRLSVFDHEYIFVFRREGGCGCGKDKAEGSIGN